MKSSNTGDLLISFIRSNHSSIFGIDKQFLSIILILIGLFPFALITKELNNYIELLSSLLLFGSLTVFFIDIIFLVRRIVKLNYLFYFELAAALLAGLLFTHLFGTSGLVKATLGCLLFSVIVARKAFIRKR